VHLALAKANQLRKRPEYRAGLAGKKDLVPYLGCHKNGASYRQFTGEAGVGTSGGSQDHAAILLSRAGQLNQWSFSPFHRLGTVAWPDDLVLTVAVSGVLAEKTSAARAHFNRVADRARAAATAWNLATGRSDASIGAAAIACGASAVLSAITDADLRLRAEQTIIETTEVVPGAVAALAAGDLARFGALTVRSQAMAGTHLQNQIPETIALVASAHLHGAVAASAFGAGFGGAVWAAFRRGHDGADAWIADYRRRFPQHSSVASLHRITPGPGAIALGLA
ncbi:MAG TPA: galactokinase, partial [Planctomycetota bacterium]|nr:galactokinase [Planctomycetota bacterium]